MQDQECEEPAHHARRPMNAFLIFCKRHREIVRDKYPDLENRSITKILGEWWGNLDKEEKACYTGLAKQYKDAFFTANPDFKWYKLQVGPPLRTLPSRVRESTEKPIESSNEYQDNELEGTINNSTKFDYNKKPNESDSESDPKPVSIVTPDKLATESQKGGLSSLLSTKTDVQTPNPYYSPSSCKFDAISTPIENTSHNSIDSPKSNSKDIIRELQNALTETTRMFEDGFEEKERLQRYSVVKDQTTNQDVNDQLTNQDIKDQTTNQDVNDQLTNQDIKDQTTNQDVNDQLTNQDIKDQTTNQDVNDQLTNQDIKDQTTNQDVNDQLTNQDIKDQTTNQDVNDQLTNQDIKDQTTNQDVNDQLTNQDIKDQTTNQDVNDQLTNQDIKDQTTNQDVNDQLTNQDIKDQTTNQDVNDQLTNQDVIDQIVDNRFSKDDDGHQRNWSEDEKNSKSGSTCKRYQEVKTVGELIVNKRQRRDYPDRLSDEGYNASCSWDPGFSLEESTVTVIDESNLNADYIQYDITIESESNVEPNDTPETDNNANKKFRAADFDLEATIKALPSHSLEEFEQKKLEIKLKKKSMPVTHRVYGLRCYGKIVKKRNYKFPPKYNKKRV